MGRVIEEVANHSDAGFVLHQEAEQVAGLMTLAVLAFQRTSRIWRIDGDSLAVGYGLDNTHACGGGHNWHNAVQLHIHVQEDICQVLDRL